MQAEEAETLVQRLREQRLTTMSLADQIKEDRWREPVLPGEWSLHGLLSHVLAWDEWAIAVFEISLIRDLPPTLQRAVDEVDAFNVRARDRFRGISRDDMLSALQAANPRLIASARASGGIQWYNRNIDGLLFLANTEKQHVPSVSEILRVLRRHESLHSQEIAATFAINPPAAQEG
jgi:hypothetical protein